MLNRVAITGFGIICSLGDNEHTIYEALLNNRVNFKISNKIPRVVISRVKDFDFKKYISRYKYARYLPRSWQFAICAAKKAILSAGLTKEHLKDAGLFVGVGPNVEAIKGEVLDKALGIVSVLPNTPLFCISHLFGIHGENLTISSACASSLQAIGEGFLRIQSGRLKIALCGGSDSRLGLMGLKLYENAKVLHKLDKDISPELSYGPFDRENLGFVPGEAGTFLVLEEMETAKKRGARVIGEIVSYSSTMDGFNPTAPDTQAIWAKKCVKEAIFRSNLPDIDVIFAHGTGTPLNDSMEINLIKMVFHSKIPFVCSIKSWIGHTGAACGATEMIVALISMKNGLLPKIRNLKFPRDEEINFLTNSKRGKFKSAIFHSFGFGGQNAAVVVRLNGI